MRTALLDSRDRFGNALSAPSAFETVPLDRLTHQGIYCIISPRHAGSRQHLYEVVAAAECLFIDPTPGIAQPKPRAKGEGHNTSFTVLNKPNRIAKLRCVPSTIAGRMCLSVCVALHSR